MARRETRRASKREIWHPAPYEIPDVRAIQHLFELAKTDHLVARALDWIIGTCSQSYDNGAMGAFACGDPHVVWFIDGRRSVGQQIVKLSKLKVSMLDPDAGHNEEGVGPEPHAIREEPEF